jgi:hypothetical protein
MTRKKQWKIIEKFLLSERYLDWKNPQEIDRKKILFLDNKHSVSNAAGVHQQTMREGDQIEGYIASVSSWIHLPKGVIEHVDFISHGHELVNVKRSWNTNNSVKADLYRILGIKVWYLYNKDGSTNWHTCPMSLKLSDSGYAKFINVEPPSTLDAFFTD